MKTPGDEGMSRSEQFTQGRRNGITCCIEWLHRRAAEMNDPQARAILNSAATNLGWADQRNELKNMGAAKEQPPCK